MKKILLCSLFLLGSTLLSAQDVKVSFIDGDLNLKTSTTWKSVQIGQFLSDADVVKLPSNSSAELETSQGRITLYKTGTYSVADLKKSLGSLGSAGWTKTAQEKMSKAFATSKPKTNASAVAGVRADSKRAANPPWSEDGEDGDKFWAQWEPLLSEGKLIDAEKALLAWSTKASDPNTISLYQGFLASAQGKRALALKLWSPVVPDDTSAAYEAFCLQKAQLLLDANQLQEAQGLMTDLAAKRPGSEDENKANALLAIIYTALGNTEAAKKAKAKSTYQL